jgi:hypothetical protein
MEERMTECRAAWRTHAVKGSVDDRANERLHERGAVISGWLAQLAICLAVFGLVAFDVIAIVAGHVSLKDDANSAAEAANQAWNESHNVQTAYNAAVAVAEQNGAQAPVEDFSIARDGTVHLRLTKTATTLLVTHIGPLKKTADVAAEGEASTPLP